MSSVRLTDGRMLHIPGTPLMLDSRSIIMAPADNDLAEVMPLIPSAQFLLFTKRLVDGARKRRRQGRYTDMNVACLRSAMMCIDRASKHWDEVQAQPDA